MVRYLASSLIGLAVAWPSLAASNYIYPLPSWHVATHHGEDIGEGLYHMGIDAGFDSPAGTAVYAVAAGVVQEAQERSQFGLVVLIEHQPVDETTNVSLYGHLDPTDVRVTPGQTVQAGDMIGVLGTLENNGGWPVHLHFGIHQAAYTGVWVYYGHVYDVATAENWYDPEIYLPEHLTSDSWQPQLALDLATDQVVGNTLDVTGTVGDIGSMVTKLRFKASADDSHWETIAVYDHPQYTLDLPINLSNYPDGSLYLRVIARDDYDNKTSLTYSLQKDPDRSTMPAFVAMKAGESDAFMTQWSFGQTALNAFFPFKQHWDNGGLLGVGDVMQNSDSELIAVRKSTQMTSTSPLVKILSPSGTVLSHFPLLDTTPTAVTVSNQIIYLAQPLTGYDATGEVIWTTNAIDQTAEITSLASDDANLYVCWQQADHSRITVIDLATGMAQRTFRPLRKAATTGCTVTLGDFTGDGQAELVVGSNGDTTGTVRLLTLNGKSLGQSWYPFGETFNGRVDISALQWDTIEDDLVETELLVSQASAGQAWVKAYRLSADQATSQALLLTKRVYEADFTQGVHIVGWPQ